MTTSRTRLLAISGTTLALVVAATGVATAHPGGRGGGEGASGDRFERRGPGGFGGIRGDARLGGVAEDIVSREVIVTTDDGIVTQRVENGTVTAVSDTAVEIELSSGDAVSVAVDDETNAMTLAEADATNPGRRGFRGPRLRPLEIAVGDISVGSDIVIWSRSQDDGSFLAQRIVVRPDVEAVADETTDVDAGAAGAADAALPPDLDTLSL